MDKIKIKLKKTENDKLSFLELCIKRHCNFCMYLESCDYTDPCLNCTTFKNFKLCKNITNDLLDFLTWSE